MRETETVTDRQRETDREKDPCKTVKLFYRNGEVYDPSGKCLKN